MLSNRGKRSKEESGKWSQLPDELLDVIVSKLSYADIQRLKAVSSSWHAFATKRFKSGPLLVLPLPSDAHRQAGEEIPLGVFSFRDNTTHNLNLRVQGEIYLLGSSYGWIVILDKDANLYLYNLFSRYHILLPVLRAILECRSFKPNIYIHKKKVEAYIVQKAILTADPSREENYKVIIIDKWLRKITFCGKGEHKWTEFNDTEGNMDDQGDYCDIVWFDKMLYALRSGLTIEGWKFTDDSRYPTRTMSINCWSNIADLNGRWYIVPSMGEILLVQRFIGECISTRGELLEDEEWLWYKSRARRTIKFEVFKADMLGGEMVRVKSLKDRVVFVGVNHGISISSSDHQEFKPNSIYFTDDHWSRTFMFSEYVGDDTGCFSLENETMGSIHECDHNILPKFEQIPFWVFPS